MNTRTIRGRRRIPDMSRISQKYAGYFVAMTDDSMKVLGKGYTPEEALAQARKKGFKEPLLAKIPMENRSYLL